MPTRSLRIGSGLTLPLDTVTATLIVYGGKGMGKTNLVSVTLEEMSKTALRWCAIDPMGVLWGLRHAADGRGNGIECLILGGTHGDMPITPASGEIVADLVADENVNVIVDCSRNASGAMWNASERTRFITAFIRRLFQRQGSLVEGHRREPIFVALDEAARYIPQTIPHGNPDLSASVSAWEQVVEEGRNVGIGVGLFTQRSARLNKSVAELADAMLAFRTTGPNSIAAIIDWLGEHVPKADQREMVAQIRKLSVGTALVVSPGWLDFEGVVAIRARETFDSSATPKPGERTRGVTGSGATVDLSVYAARMAEVVEEAIANDPKRLRADLAASQREIGRLGRLLSMARSVLADRTGREVGEDVSTVIVALDNERCQEIGRLNAHLAVQPEPVGIPDGIVEIVQAAESAAAVIRSQAEEVLTCLSKALVESGEAKIAATRIKGPESRVLNRESLPPTRAPRPAPKPFQRAPQEPPAPRRETHQVGMVDESLSGAERKILTVLAQHGPRTPTKIAHLAAYSPTGAFSRAMTALRGRGFIDGSPVASITDEGLTALGDYTPLPSGRALVDHWLNRLKGVEAKILTTLCEHYPEALTPTEVAEINDYSPTGAFSRAFTHLRKLDLVVNGGGRGSATVNEEIGQAWQQN